MNEMKFKRDTAGMSEVSACFVVLGLIQIFVRSLFVVLFEFLLHFVIRVHMSAMCVCCGFGTLWAGFRVGFKHLHSHSLSEASSIFVDLLYDVMFSEFICPWDLHRCLDMKWELLAMRNELQLYSAL